MTYPGGEAGDVAEGVDQGDADGGRRAGEELAGTVQKLGSAAKMAHAVTVMTATVAAGEPHEQGERHAQSADEGGYGDVPGLHAALGGVRDQKYRTMAAGRYGMAVIRPFSKTSNLVPNWSWNPAMMVGRKNASA